jgi:hypothetical protein
MADNGLHGSPAFAEAHGGQWSKHDRSMMAAFRKSDAEWCEMRRKGIAYVEALQALVRASLGL